MDTQGENPRLAIVAVGEDLPRGVKPHKVPAEVDIKVAPLPKKGEKATEGEAAAEVDPEKEEPSPLDKAALAKKTSRRRTEEKDSEETPDSKTDQVALETGVGGLESGETVYDRDDSPGSQVMAQWLKRANADETETETTEAESKKKTKAKKTTSRRGRRGSALRSK